MAGCERAKGAREGLANRSNQGWLRPVRSHSVEPLHSRIDGPARALELHGNFIGRLPIFQHITELILFSGRPRSLCWSRRAHSPLGNARSVPAHRFARTAICKSGMAFA
jgi:hypothetical protein